MSVKVDFDDNAPVNSIRGSKDDIPSMVEAFRQQAADNKISSETAENAVAVLQLLAERNVPGAALFLGGTNENESLVFAMGDNDADRELYQEFSVTTAEEVSISRSLLHGLRNLGLVLPASLVLGAPDHIKQQIYSLIKAGEREKKNAN